MKKNNVATVRWALGLMRAHLLEAEKDLKKRNYRGMWASLGCAHLYAESAAEIRARNLQGK